MQTPAKELASYRSVLRRTVNLEFCKPPYKSPKLRLTVSDEQLNNFAKKVGGEEIVRSATSMGDFANYEVMPRVGHFLRIPLDKNVLLSDEQKARAFESEVVGHCRERIQAFERLEETANPYTYGIASLGFDTKPKQLTKEQINK